MQRGPLAARSRWLAVAALLCAAAAGAADRVVLCEEFSNVF